MFLLIQDKQKNDLAMFEPTQFYKCLSDDTRLKILLLILKERELCVCELTTALDEIQPKISRHLAYLKNSEILEDDRHGQWVYYRLNVTLPAWAISILETTEANHSQAIEKPLSRLTDMGDRPTRKAFLCKG
ncbi:metalloregulator ArsR/SmtB family transcription factor [Aliikangiella sp. IMCC44359]|uniref:metalloregulator ArsR/SmtB family transcription factor n=1 Tax=Aliikangiella sp. IMCC44359 TaxID=3459125 RepID=UPI00403ABE53